MSPLEALEPQRSARSEAEPPPGRARVRPLEERDLPGVIALYERIFAAHPGAITGAARSHLRDTFWGHPWRDDGLPSLIGEDETGRVVGCLGVMPRPMSFGGRTIRAAITHTFMAEPRGRARLAGIELARAFMSGPQDLSIAEGGAASRRILERCGGARVLAHSLRWTRPLRPSRYLLSHLSRHGVRLAATRALRPLAGAADAILARWPGAPFSTAASRLDQESLPPAGLQKEIEELSRGRMLRPVYRPATLRWLLDLLARRRDRGALETAALRDEAGRIAGWFVTYVNPGGISEVVQVGARDAALPRVLEHLFHRLRLRGSIAASGQLDPPAFEAFARAGCLFHHDGYSWFLAHARHPELLDAIHRGDAYLTRLEGEWSVGY